MPRRTTFVTGLELCSSLILPVVILAVIVLSMGEGYQTLARIHDVALIGPVAYWADRAILSMYFPPFLVTGSVGPVFGVLGLYLAFLVVFLVRRKWISAAVILLLPPVFTWVFSAILLGD